MSSPSSVIRIRSWPFVAVVLAAGVLVGIAAPPLRSQPAATSNDEQVAELWVDYWEASLKLAEADLKLAEATNQRAQGAVSKYDLKRLEMRRGFFEQARSQLNRGRDFGDVAAGYADLNARLAALDVEMAADARRHEPNSISAAQYGPDGPARRGVPVAGRAGPRSCRVRRAGRPPARRNPPPDRRADATDRRISRLEEIVLR